MSKSNELENDIVTVSKLQVALLATTPSIQSELTEISLNADTETSEGLFKLLENVTQALLRNSTYWTHALGSSQTIPSREEAERVFESLSIGERRKFTAETLSNVDGKITQSPPVSPVLYDGPPAYIVVTLLVGTADDRPLLGEINSKAALKAILEKLGSMRSDYLMVFELLWSPQLETDSLTEQEFETEYADLVAIA